MDDGIGVSPDTEGYGLAIDAERIAAGIYADAGLAPFCLGRLPFEFGKFEGTGGACQLGFGPVGPVAAETITGVGNDEVQVAGPADIGLQRHCVSRGIGCDDGTGGQRARRCCRQ